MNDLDTSLMTLLLNSSEPLKSAELAFALGVSEKTVLKHLNSLKKTLRTYGASIEIKQGAGSYLTIQDQKLFDGYLKEMSHNLNLDNPEIRKAYILLRLLCTADYIDPYEFADELYISPSLLRQTIKNLVTTLDKYDLQIDHSHNNGYRIKGDEKNIRQCLSQECSGLNDFSEVMTSGDFRQTELELIRKIVTESLDHYHVAISKNGISPLTLHILIAINRMETDNLIQIDHSKLISTKIRTSPEYFVASRIGKAINQELGIDMPENELAYLTIHITGKQRIYGHEQIQVKVDQEALIFYNKFLRNIYKMANEDFFEDEELRISLLNHIVPFLNRYRNRMMIAKTDLPNIKNEFPYAYELALFGLSTLDQDILTSAEVSYFALHLALSIEKRKETTSRFNILVVCNEVSSVFRILSFKLDKSFKHYINMTKFITLDDLDKFDLSEYELILNTTGRPLPMESLKISTFLTENDTSNIQDALDSLNKKERLYTLMPEELFLQLDAVSPLQVFMAQEQILKQAYELPSDFVQRILAREHYESTEYENRIACPHPLNTENIPPFVSVARLNKPIIWKEKNVQLVFLFSSLGSKNTSWFFEKIAKLATDSSLARKLIEADSYEEFIDVFEKA